jgi:uncharacterized membrane protein
MDYAKCAFCKEKDHTKNMLMPCRCDHWVHRDCLNKKRIADPNYFSECPVCKSAYNLEQKKIPEWRKYAEIIGSVVLDLATFAMLFCAASIATGKLLIALKVESRLTPGQLGAFVICGVLGFIAFIAGIVMIMKDQPVYLYWFHGIQCDNDSAPLIFVTIGAIVLAIAAVWWAVVTIKARIEKHQRAIGVKEFVVKDYTRGIQDL